MALQAKLAADTAAWETERKELYEEMDERARQHKSVVAEKQAQQSSYDEAAAAAAEHKARAVAEVCAAQNAVCWWVRVGSDICVLSESKCFSLCPS
jgi:hypothetical protein